MPVGRKIGQKIITGTVASSSLTDTYLVTAFPVQSDQNDACPWIIDGSGTTTPTAARISTNADLSRSDDGFYSWAWRMVYMTFGMVNYWNTALLPAGAWSAPVTVLTYDENNLAVYLNATIWRPNFPGPDAQYAPGGWGNVIWRFNAGTIIAPP